MEAGLNPETKTQAEAFRRSEDLFVHDNPLSPASESLRWVRSALLSSLPTNGASARSFLVVGSHAGAGCSYLAANLAVIFAQSGLKTLIVDANLRDPRVGQIFGCDQLRGGLAELLQRNGLNASEFILGREPSLSVLASGATPRNPQELLAARAFEEMVASFNKDYDIVIYDVPPALEFSDAYVVARAVGASVIVARKNVEKYADVKEIVKRLRLVNCIVAGSVLNLA